MLQALLALLSGEDKAADVEEEIRLARKDLDAALDALRAARGSWTSSATVDIAAVQRALATAERQLDAARVRLLRAQKK